VMFYGRMSGAPLELLRAAVERTRVLTQGRPTTGRSHDGADDTVGSFATDSALRFDPFPLLAAVHRAGARVVVIGQVAGIMHGSVELTGDLDLLWDGAAAQAGALAAAFGSLRSRLHDDDGALLMPGPEAFVSAAQGSVRVVLGEWRLLHPGTALGRVAGSGHSRPSAHGVPLGWVRGALSPPRGPDPDASGGGSAEGPAPGR